MVLTRGDHQIGGLETAFQQQDGVTEMRIAQPHRIIEIEQREAVCLLQRAGRAQQAMTVGIGLDDGPDTRAIDARTDTTQIGAQRIQIESGANGTRHGENQLDTEWQDKTGLKPRTPGNLRV